MTKVKLKVKKDDQVVVLAGKDKGKKGTIIKVFPETLRVVVSGVNMIKLHEKPSVKGPGGITRKEASIHISNVALADPKDGKATRVGYKKLKDGTKVRFARRSGEEIK